MGFIFDTQPSVDLSSRCSYWTYTVQDPRRGIVLLRYPDIYDFFDLFAVQQANSASGVLENESQWSGSAIMGMGWAFRLRGIYFLGIEHGEEWR
jgi:hypothetical protein